MTSRTAAAKPLAWGARAFCVLVAMLALVGCDGPGPSGARQAPTELAPSTSAAHAYYSYPTAATAASGAPIPTGGAMDALDTGSGALAWRRTIHTPLFQPAEIDGVVYATSYSDDPRTSWLDAFDPQTGKPLWSHETPGTFNSAPVVAGGAIYVTSQQPAGNDSSGVLQALDEHSGALRWAFPVTETPSPATVDGGSVYLSGMGNVLETSALYAIDATTGKARWSYTSPAQLATLDPGQGYPDTLLPPLVSDGVVAVVSTIRDSHGFAIQSTLALDPATGKPRWSYSTGGLLDALVHADGVLYLAAHIPTGNTSRSFIAALRMSDGALAWRAEAGDRFITGLAFVEGQGAVADARLLAIESVESQGVSAASMLGLAPADGRILWTTPLGQGALGPPLLAGGLALAQVTAPTAASHTALRLLAVQPSDGQLRWRQNDGDSTAFGHAMWVVGDSVLSVITTSSGSGPTISILAMRVSDGARQWQVKPQ